MQIMVDLFLHGFTMFLKDLKVTLTGDGRHVFAKCCKFLKNQAFPESCVIKLLVPTQTVPLTGTSSQYFLSEEDFVPSKVMLSLALFIRRDINSLAFFKHIGTASAAGKRQLAASP